MKLKQFFLFQTAPVSDWAKGRRIAFMSWNLAMVLIFGAGLGAASIFLAAGPYLMTPIFRGYLECPLILVLNLLPAVVLVMLLYGLTGRAWISFLASSAAVLGLSLGNYYKLIFRNDPLMFADLLLLKEAGSMAGKYSLFPDWKVITVLACAAAVTVFLFFLVRWRPPRMGRIGLSLAGLILAAVLAPAVLSDSVYYNRTANYSHLENVWSDTQKYISRGFLYPFLHSIPEAVDTPPAGYDEKAAEALLNSYSDSDIPEDKKVNIIGIMLEAYNDFTRFGTPRLSSDVYEVWHRLEDEGYSGDLITNIFAGGTVDTERCFITGYSDLVNFRAPVNSYAWYLRTQGYRAEGMHPSFEWFYNRQNVNKYLGFQDYWFVENYFGVLTKGNVATDDIFIRELINAYDAAADAGGPYFNFSVSYQGHGPYESAKLWWGEKGDYVEDDGTYTDEQLTVMENYFGSINNTNRQLEILTGHLRDDDEPAVLILFGDHNPWMGDGNSVYEAMGIDFDLSTKEGFENYYGTRYIIWANDRAKEILGNSFTGEGPALSPNFLMNEVFRLCGWTGPAYMQAADEVCARVPVINTPTGLYEENGLVTDTLSSEAQALADGYKFLEYYYRRNFRYEELTA